MSNRIVFVVGMAGAGKSLVSEVLVKEGFSFFRFGQIVLDKVREAGLKINEDNEREIREGIREAGGMAAIADLAIPVFDKMLFKGHVVGDGLYSWSEYKVLKDKYGDRMTVIAVYASPKMRHERLEKRIVEDDPDLRFRPFSKEDARKRDYAEIDGLEKGGPIAMADYTIINTGNIEDARKETKRILKAILRAVK